MKRCDLFISLEYISGLLPFIFFHSVMGLQPNEVPTPCNFPIPSASNYEPLCMRYLDIRYLCDVEQVLSRTGAEKIVNVLKKNNKTFHVVDRLKSKDDVLKIEVGIAIVQKIVMPDHDPQMLTQDYGKIATSKEFYCVFGENFPQISERRWAEEDYLRYLSTFAHVLRRRWFASDCGVHFFVLASMEGKPNDWSICSLKYGLGAVSLNRSRAIFDRPLVEVAFGGDLWTILGPEVAGQLHSYASKSLSDGWPVSAVIARTLRKLAEFSRAFQEKKKVVHEIPRWAWEAWFAALAVAFALVAIDWIVVRSKGFSLASLGGRGGGGGGGGDTGGGGGGTSSGRTHLMF